MYYKEFDTFSDILKNIEVSMVKQNRNKLLYLIKSLLSLDGNASSEHHTHHLKMIGPEVLIVTT